MSNEIVLSVRLQVHAGKVDAFEEAVGRLVKGVEANEPGLLYYKFFISSDKTEARAIHIYADSKAFRDHVEISAEWVANVLQYASLSNIELLGDPEPGTVGGAYQAPAVVSSVAGFMRIGK